MERRLRALQFCKAMLGIYLRGRLDYDSTAGRICLAIVLLTAFGAFETSDGEIWVRPSDSKSEIPVAAVLAGAAAIILIHVMYTALSIVPRLLLSHDRASTCGTFQGARDYPMPSSNASTKIWMWQETSPTGPRLSRISLQT